MQLKIILVKSDSKTDIKNFFKNFLELLNLLKSSV